MDRMPRHLRQVHACMKTLEDVGLSSLKFAKLAAETLRTPLVDIIEQLWFEDLAAELKILVGGLVSTKNCNTWPVARVLNGNCLVEFSAYNIPKLSLIFALIANDEKTWAEVLSWPSLKSTLVFKSLAEELARAVKEVKSTVSSFKPISEGAKTTK